MVQLTCSCYNYIDYSSCHFSCKKIWRRWWRWLVNSIVSFRNMRNKKGQLGLDTATKFIIAILILGIIGVVAVIALATLNDVGKSALPIEDSVTVVNTTLTTVNEAGEELTAATAAGYNPVCTVSAVMNATNVGPATLIGPTTYTVLNCGIRYSATGVNASSNNTDWIVTYSYTYQRGELHSVMTNSTSGLTELFGNSVTWF